MTADISVWPGHSATWILPAAYTPRYFNDITPSDPTKKTLCSNELTFPFFAHLWKLCNKMICISNVSTIVNGKFIRLSSFLLVWDWREIFSQHQPLADYYRSKGPILGSQKQSFFVNRFFSSYALFNFYLQLVCIFLVYTLGKKKCLSLPRFVPKKWLETANSFEAWTERGIKRF